MPLPSPSVKIQIMDRKGVKAKQSWMLSMLSNVLTLSLKQTFPPKIQIFTEGEGDEIESRQPFKKSSIY